MLDVLSALTPVFLAIAFGNALRRLKFPGEAFWPELDRMNYTLLAPALVINAMNAAPLTLAAIGKLGLIALATIATAFALLEALRHVLPIAPRPFTSVVQGTLRWNGFVSMAVIGGLFGAQGVALTGVSFLVLTPVLNVLSVLVLLRHGGEAPRGARDILPSLARNPLIWGCLIGLTLNWTGIGLPGPFSTFFKLVADTALVLGLLSVGAALDIRVFAVSPRLVALAVGMKLLLVPAIVLGWSSVVGVDATMRGVALLSIGAPTGPAAYALAKVMGGDAPLMAAIITATTLGAALTIPLMALLLS